MLDRLPIPAAAALLGAAAIVLLAIAFVAGRMTASSAAHPVSALTPVRTSGTSLSLPHLSEALPLPALAALPAKATPAKTAPVTTGQPPVRHKPPKKASNPVDITGSG